MNDPDPLAGRRGRAGRLEAVLSVLNAVVGDHLGRRSNPLEIPFGLAHAGRPLPCTREAIARAHPSATGKLCVLVHGLAVNEDVWSFPDDRRRTYGSMLERDLGYTAFQVRYNTGLRVGENGRALARTMAALVRCHPVKVREIVLVGHSMGGLVVRSACEVARVRRQRWLARVSHAFYLGAPHRGAPLERLGDLVVRVLRAVGVSHTTLIADVADLRSAGIKDLRHAHLVVGDRRADRDPAALLAEPCAAIPLAPGISHHFGVGGIGAHERHPATLLLGDALVPVESAAPRAAPPAGGSPVDVQFFPRTGHVALAHHPEVYAWIEACCSGQHAKEAP